MGERISHKEDNQEPSNHITWRVGCTQAPPSLGTRVSRPEYEARLCNMCKLVAGVFRRGILCAFCLRTFCLLLLQIVHESALPTLN